MRRLRRAYVVSAALAFGVIGCELIVSSSVPDFRCEPGMPGVCPSGQTCDFTSRTCVSATDSGLTDVTPTADRDVTPGDDDAEPGKGEPIGAPCLKSIATPKPCAAGLLCATTNTLTTTIVKTDEFICTKTCCTSSDCPQDFVCYGSGTGGNYCVSAERAKRTNGLGTKSGGADCDDNAECRSGICADDHCLDLCCKETDCGGGTTCRVKSISAPPPARETWVCAMPEASGTLKPGSGTCSGAATCRNDNCAGFPGRCRPTCCSSKDCVDVDTGSTSKFAVCAYGSFPATQTQTKWCFDGPPDGSAPLAPEGASCSANNECADRFCDRDIGKCGRVCCQDSDCKDSESCEPAPSGTPFLRCVPKTEVQ